MKFVVVFFTMIFISNAYSKEFLLKLNIGNFLEKIKNYDKDRRFVYKNNDIPKNSPQLYFLRDEKSNNNFGDFDKEVIEYGFVDMGKDIDYIYAEHFFDCKSKHKIIYSQIFDKNGVYLRSKISYYKFEDSSLQLDQIICSIN